MPARALMFQGTGSDVGKSTMVAAMCRLLMRQGLRVRPFKPQNMSNNAAVTADGGEIGRAQALQARACGVLPSVHMNPVLLKPESDRRCQVVVQGRVRGTWQARAYQAEKPQLLGAVLESFRVLQAEADVVLVEGAGSPAETNLRAGDIANMGFALAAGVPVCLVADIDRGGVIASVVGTRAVLDPADRAAIVGYVVNKFRGDQTLFEDGILHIGQHTGWPCFGVLPWQAAAARLPAEDAVALEGLTPADAEARITVAVPMLSRIANFDDLDPLKAEPGVRVKMVPPGTPLPRDADVIVLPGTKATIADLDFMRLQGWDIDVLAHVRHGGSVIGLCGGYQMLGSAVADPLGVEGPPRSVRGLGLLDVETVLEADKTLVEVRGRHLATNQPVSGYEIHVGSTRGPDCDRPVLRLEGGRYDGAQDKSGRVMGTYVHGLFAADEFRRALLRTLQPGVRLGSLAYEAQVDQALNDMADALGRHVRVEALLQTAR